MDFAYCGATFARRSPSELHFFSPLGPGGCRGSASASAARLIARHDASPKGGLPPHRDDFELSSIGVPTILFCTHRACLHYRQMRTEFMPLFSFARRSALWAALDLGACRIPSFKIGSGSKLSGRGKAGPHLIVPQTPCYNCPQSPRHRSSLTWRYVDAIRPIGQVVIGREWLSKNLPPAFRFSEPFGCSRLITKGRSVFTAQCIFPLAFGA